MKIPVEYGGLGLPLLYYDGAARPNLHRKVSATTKATISGRP